MTKRKFVDMINIIPPGKCGDYVFEAYHENGGTILVRHGKHIVMHDDDMMRQTHQEFLDNAHGDILLGGLGLGLVIVPLIDDVYVDSITVIEMDSHIIDYVKPFLNHLDIFHKLRIVNDSMENFPLLDRLYDVIYLDLSEIGCYNNQYHNDDFRYLQKKLTDNYGRRLLKPTPDAFVSCWGYNA